MDKIKKVINSSLFQSAIAGGIGIALLTQGHPLYAGIAVGVGLTTFIKAFKSS
tara:strand:- start:181 stop:339 length:159 start_codon:yes stop_codon:yes gene_type:complete